MYSIVCSCTEFKFYKSQLYSTVLLNGTNLYITLLNSTKLNSNESILYSTVLTCTPTYSILLIWTQLYSPVQLNCTLSIILSQLRYKVPWNGGVQVSTEWLVNWLRLQPIQCVLNWHGMLQQVAHNCIRPTELNWIIHTLK